MSKWKLYWVASDGLEDCFVVAKNSRSARRIEKQMNGFEDDDINVFRVADVPDKFEKIANKKFIKWSKENNCNNHLDIDNLLAWPYYARHWLLKGIGAEFRKVDGIDEVLINDMIYSANGIRPIGARAMKEIAELTGQKFISADNIDYSGIRETIDKMIGTCMIIIHQLEKYITDSFIFAIGNKKYDKLTIDDVKEFWKEKCTFGRLLRIIEERYTIQEDTHNALKLFLYQRNKLVHGLTTDERFDIHTLWGQKEIVAFIAVFLKNSCLLEEVLESAYVATMSFGLFMAKENKSNKEIRKIASEFNNDQDIQEKCALFFENFKIKEFED